jgi:hypothetical protein
MEGDKEKEKIIDDNVEVVSEGTSEAKETKEATDGDATPKKKALDVLYCGGEKDFHDVLEILVNLTS